MLPQVGWARSALLLTADLPVAQGARRSCAASRRAARSLPSAL